MQKENFLTHKILPIISIILLCSFVFINNSVFASSSINVNYNGNSVELPSISTIDFSSYDNFDSSCDYLIFYGWNAYRIAVLPKGYSLKIYSYNNGTGLCMEDNSTTMLHYYFSNDSWVFAESNPWLDHIASDGWFYSTVDIYNKNSEEIFFQKTPVTTPAAVEIPALEKVEQIPEAITTTLKLIIPVSLIVLSIFFVIYLMRRLIYRSL